ncbi:MAG: hypothetical protein H6Q72_4123 [Firmicutes bacterium]|nr:hypothetical protein [Bacillota bacterium]
MTKYDICNMALTFIGSTRPISSFADQSTEATICGRFYDIARKSLLNETDWNFAKQSYTALTVVTDEANQEYQYVYEYPDDAIRILSVGLGDHHKEPFKIIYTDTDTDSVQRIVCNLKNAMAEYIVNVENTDLMPAYFTEALAWKLGGMIAIGLAKTPQIAQNAMQIQQGIVERAKYLSGAEKKQPLRSDNHYIRARR